MDSSLGRRKAARYSSGKDARASVEYVLYHSFWLPSTVKALRYLDALSVCASSVVFAARSMISARRSFCPDRYR